MLFPLVARRALLLAVLALPVAGRAGAQANATVDNVAFTATVTSLQTSAGGNGLHFVTATVHFQNRTKKPLVLAIEKAKATATDDQGNRFGLLSLRGIGVIGGSGVDAKFVLPPLGGSDAFFELSARLAASTVRGVIFTLDLAPREILPLASGQVKMGVERALEFTGLQHGSRATPPTPSDDPGIVLDAKPFSAEVVRTKADASGNRRLQVVEITMRLTNRSAAPLILAYDALSDFGIDDQGNRYVYGRPGTHDTGATGIGYATGAAVDPQFALAPGESREAHFTVIRGVGKEVAGTKLVYYVAFDALEVLPSKQIRTLRQYSVMFPDLPLVG